MATEHSITPLISTLTTLAATVCCSESDKRRASAAAINCIRKSPLDTEDKNQVISTILRAANPTGWHWDFHGIRAGIEVLEGIRELEPTVPFNVRNLHNLVADGAIFSVEFVKRSDGTVRKMVCRTGVGKYLHGGKAAYEAKSRNLLTVFDMEAKGYRSVPVDAIKRLSVGGQTFSFGGAV